MRLLLDTPLLLWALDDPAKLPAAARQGILDPANEVLFSAASIWEIAIKAELGRGDFAAKPEDIACVAVDSGFDELPVSAQHAALTARLPRHHRDPFEIGRPAGWRPVRTDGAMGCDRRQCKPIDDLRTTR